MSEEFRLSVSMLEAAGLAVRASDATIMPYMPQPTITMLKVSDNDIERIARRVVELMKEQKP